MSNPFDPFASFPFGPSAAPSDEQLRALRERQSNAWAGLTPPPPGVATPQFRSPPGGFPGSLPMSPFGQLSLLEAALSGGRTAAGLRAEALENLARHGISSFGTPAPGPQIPSPNVGLLNPAPMAGPAGQFGLPMGLPPDGSVSTVPDLGEPNRGLPSGSAESGYHDCIANGGTRSSNSGWSFCTPGSISSTPDGRGGYTYSFSSEFFARSPEGAYMSFGSHWWVGVDASGRVTIHGY